jgi:hypothetical protein
VSDVRDLKDSDVTNDVTSDGSSFGPFGVQTEWDGYGGSGSVSVGGVDLLRFDPVKDIPGLSGLTQAISAGAKWAAGDSDWAELYNIAGSVGDLGVNVITYIADPLNFLISAGLTFLIDVVQPLEDLLGLVTGNAERMEGEIAKWERVGNALEPLAEEIKKAGEEGLAGWQGLAADKAKQRIAEFAEGVAGIANDVKQLVMIMNIAKLVMEIAQAFIIGLISTFVEWLVFTWTAALAAAVPTAGASTAAAAAATTAQAATTMSRGVAFVTRVVGILRRLRAVLMRMHPRIMRRVQASFQNRVNGRFAPGWQGPGTALRNSLTDWRTWTGPVDKALTTLGNESKRWHDYATDDNKLSDAEQDARLDPNR